MHWYNTEDLNINAMATVLRVEIANSTDSWSVVFPLAGLLPINVICAANTSLCPLAASQSCHQTSSIHTPSRSQGGALSVESTPACLVGTDATPHLQYGLKVSGCMIMNDLQLLLQYSVCSWWFLVVKLCLLSL